jgi:peptide/nickel transport system substrate-binding protein
MKNLLLLLAPLGLGVALAQSATDTYIEQSFAEVDTLDPVQAYDSASGQIIENVYEALYSYAGDSVTSTNRASLPIIKCRTTTSPTPSRCA